MSWTDPFEVLGLERTSDTTAIRRAYARKLKVTNPEDDAEAFQALRAAYEHALHVAQYIAEDEAEAAADIPRAVIDEPALNELLGPEPAPALDPEPPMTEPSPAQPWGAPRAAADHVSRGEIDDLNAAIARLESLLQAKDVDRAAARDALRAILALPAMDAMDVRDQVEHSIGVIVLNAGAHAAFMIDAATEAFQWDSDRLRGRSAIGQAVLARREGLVFLLTMQRPASDVHGAWKALSQKPTGERLAWNRVTLGLPQQVRRVLTTVDQQHPYLLEEFDPDALAWWRRHLAAPQFGPGAVWSAVVLPLILTPIVAKIWSFGESDTSAFAAAYPAALAGVLALLGGGLGLLRLQDLWRRTRGYEASAWEKIGWAPAALGALAGAAAAPTGFGWAFAALATLAAGWAVVTADPGDGQDTEEVLWSFPSALIPMWQIPIRMPRWLHRALGLTGLAILCFVLRETAPDLPWGPLVAAGVATGAAFVAGHFTLDEAWRDLMPRTQAISLGLGAVVTGAVPLFLWSTAPDLRLIPLGFAAIAAPVLLERVVSLDAPTNRLRGLLLGWGWLPAVLFIDVLDSEIRHGNAALLGGGLWLLSAAAVGLVAALRRERRTYGQAYA